MAFPYSAVFSAFGASSADYRHNYTLATNIVVPPMAGDDVKMACGQAMNRAWKTLREEAFAQTEKEGFSPEQLTLLPQAMIRYGRQLDDLIVSSPVTNIDSPADWDALIKAFEDAYEAIYTQASKFPEAGYEIFEAGMIATVPKIKPVLKKYDLVSEVPPNESLKGSRECYFKGAWSETPIYDGHTLLAGNVVKGPSMIEFSTSTMVVPPDRVAHVDEYLTFWLR